METKELKPVDRKLDELLINNIYDNTVVHIKSYDALQTLRENYWHDEFYRISKKDNPDYFGMVHELSDLYAVDGIFGIENSNGYFNRCVAKMTEDAAFDYIPMIDLLRFADALFSTGHRDAIGLFNASMREDFDENIFKAYLKSPVREKRFYRTDYLDS